MNLRMNYNNMFDEIYDNWIDQISQMPLTNFNRRASMRAGNITRALQINNQLINNLYSIRRHLEMQDDNDEMYTYQLPSFRINDFFSMMQGMFEEIIINNNNVDQQPMEDVKVVMNEEDFEKMPCKIIQTKDDKKECNICIEVYKNGDKVIELPCNHLFHKECIKQWLCKEKINCPVCRYDIRDSQSKGI
jgi:hypothetical protein